MSGDDENGSSSLDEHDLETLRTTQNEARAVLDHQIDTFRHVDDKAARTLRLDAILLGLLITAVSFVSRSDGVDIDPFMNWLTICGATLLLLSFIFAVWTLTVTNIQTGVGPNDIQRLVDEKYDEKSWLILLLRSEAEWMRWNDRQQSLNGTLLTISHVTLILSVVGLAAGLALPVLPV